MRLLLSLSLSRFGSLKFHGKSKNCCGFFSAFSFSFSFVYYLFLRSSSFRYVVVAPPTHAADLVARWHHFWRLPLRHTHREGEGEGRQDVDCICLLHSPNNNFQRAHLMNRCSSNWPQVSGGLICQVHTRAGGGGGAGAGGGDKG